MKRRFYAFATKRNHANLPPILTLARRGDIVVWLETETARKHAWARDCSSMLEQDRGIRCEVKPVAEDDVYAPNRMRDMLAEEVRRNSTDEPFFAITGGQKHSVLGWDRATSSRLKPA